MPLAAILLGLLVGAAASLFKSALQKPVRRTVLGNQLRDNRAAGDGERIEGLTEFARDRLAAGETIDDVIAKVAEMRQKGPGAAKQARIVLLNALGEGEAELKSHPLRPVAEKEARRTDHRSDDFYGKDGERKPHPAASLAQAVVQLTQDYLPYVATLHTEIDKLDPAHRVAAAQALARAELVAREAAKPEDVARIAGLLAAARDAVETARAQVAAAHGEEVRRGNVFREDGEEGDDVPLAPTAPLPVEAAELGGATLGSTGALAIAGTALAALLIVVFAIVTIKQSIYEPKLTFATCGDYFTLFSTALASAAVGSVILLLGYWSPIVPAEE